MELAPGESPAEPAQVCPQCRRVAQGGPPATAGQDMTADPPARGPVGWLAGPLGAIRDTVACHRLPGAALLLAWLGLGALALVVSLKAGR